MWIGLGLSIQESLPEVPANEQHKSGEVERSGAKVSPAKK